ncbi:MAG TPA: GAF domain-containing sensor histidine kinase [Myxococcales bacterium]|jgi:signal transduction histidine kinase
MELATNPSLSNLSPPARPSARQSDRLVRAVLELSRQRDLRGVMDVVRVAARDLTGADGVTFVLREGELVHYAEENAIARLWKGQRFPASACISGWVMVHRTPALVEDVFADERIPADLYRPTFVKSLAMVPIRAEDPLGAIGAYWADPHLASETEIELLQSLAESSALAMENAELHLELQRAVSAREEFSAIAAHELRTPLTPLKMLLEVLSRDPGQDPEDLQRRLARMQGQVSRLERLAEHLLDDTRLANGHLLLDLRETDLAELALQAAQRHREDFAARGTPLSVDAPEPVLGLWDASRLDRLLENLLSNALRFAPGLPVTVSVGLADDGRAVLAVADQGPGIPAEAQERVFGRFERAAPLAHFGGFGLGLWIVRQAVDAHRGEVLLDSAPGRGCTFRVLLPLRR